jgi:hypothetical protein
MILYMFRASHAHLQEDIVYLQYLVSSHSAIQCTDYERTAVRS